jgi:hypothetical protein
MCSNDKYTSPLCDPNLDKVNGKRLEQLRKAWIDNVVRITTLSQEDAEKLYDKVKPYRNDKS